ncbi:MAG: hypothetical protein ACRET5_10335 [Steroidobacteraceae bacterium]
MTTEAVSIEVFCTRKPANPGRVGRKGWWSFTLRGDDFSITPDCEPDEISPEDAEAKARALCSRLGLAVLHVDVLPDPPG